MKLTNKKVIDLLKSIGLDVELVADDAAADADYAQDAAIQTIDAARTPIISQKVLSDENAKIYGNVTAKVHGGFRKGLIAKGVPAAELEGKDASEMTEIAFAHFTKNGGADKETLTKQLADMAAAHEKAIGKVKTEWETKYNEQGEKLTAKEQLTLLQGIYKNAKGIAQGANIDILSSDFLNNLKQNAVVRLSADGKTFELFDKVNPDKRLMNEAGTNFAKVDDMLKSYHAPRGQWNEDNRNINAVDQMKNRIDLSTSVDKNGRIETPESKQEALVAAWANEGVSA